MTKTYTQEQLDKALTNQRKAILEEVRSEVEKQKLGSFKEWIKSTKKYGGTRAEWLSLNNRSHDKVLSDILQKLSILEGETK